MIVNNFIDNIKGVNKMKGPYKLSDDSIMKEVKKSGKPGNYILLRQEKDGINHIYIGRSDNDLQGRLLSHFYNKESYTDFFYDYADSAKEAYEGECKYYHKYYDNPKKLKELNIIFDNKIHPDNPDSKKYKCPECGN